VTTAKSFCYACAGFFLLVAAALQVCPCHAQSYTAQIEILPASPTADDEIRIRLFGNWPDACVPEAPQLSIIDSEIRIETSTPGELCPPVVTSWELSVDVGRLPEGNYAVTVRFTTPFDPSGEVIGQSAFVVGEVSVESATWSHVKAIYKYGHQRN
jgi:hypothetical protein